MKDKLFLIQDTRSWDCNCVLWWREFNCGYTTHVEEARKFSFDDIYDEDGILRDSWDASKYKVFPDDKVMKAATLQLDIQKYREIENASR